MNSLSKLATAIAVALSFAATASAGQVARDSGDTHATASQSAQNHSESSEKGEPADRMTDGEIKKVDKDAGKITIHHGELKNLGMPAMTMVFRAKDPAMLDYVKVGDKVKFVAEKAGGAFTVVQLQTAH